MTTTALPRVTVPCRQAPDAWNLSEHDLMRLQPEHINQAEDAVTACGRCPIKDACDSARPPVTGPTAYTHRTVQAGWVFEPDAGWMSLADWLKLTRYHPCEACGAPTRSALYCSRRCAIRSRHQAARDEAGPKPARVSRKDDLRPPKRPRILADIPRIRAMYAAGDSVHKIAKLTNLHVDTVRRHIRPVAKKPTTGQKVTAVARLTDQGLSANQIGRQLGLDKRTVRAYRAKARELAEAQKAVA